MKKFIFIFALLLLGSCKFYTEPTPPPPPVDLAHLSLVVVQDPLDWSPAQGQLFTDESFRTYVESQGHDIRLVCRDQQGKDLSKYLDYLNSLEEQNGKKVKLPWLLVGRNGQVVYNNALPIDPKEAVSLVQKLETINKKPQEIVWEGGAWRRLGGLKPPEPKLASRWLGRVYGPDTPDEPLIPRNKWKDISLSRYNVEVLDQDEQSSCSAATTVQLARTLHSICGYKDERWSVADLYRRGNKGVDDGMMLETALDLITKEGVCSVQFCDMWNWTKPNYKKGYEADRAKHKVLKPFYCPTIDNVCSALQRCKPVAIGIVYTSSFTPDADGFVGEYGGRVKGGHALLVLGMKMKGKVAYLKIRNSWGKEWGKNGEAFIHESWFVPDFGAWTAAVSVNDPDDLLAN